MKKGIDNLEKPTNFCDYEKDHMLVLNQNQNALVSLFMAISNCSLTIALCVTIIKYKDSLDMTVVILITLAACFSGLVEKMLLGSIQRHDHAIILEYEINKDYIKNKEVSMKDRENAILEKRRLIREKQQKVILQNGKSIAELKDQIHNVVIND